MTKKKTPAAAPASTQASAATPATSEPAVPVNPAPSPSEPVPASPEAATAPAAPTAPAGTADSAESKSSAASGTSGDGTGIEDEAAIAAALAVSKDAVKDPHAVADTTELADLAARATGFKGLDENLNPPTMVNGQSVAGMKHDPESDTWVKDPDAASGTERKQDLIDRIARSFPNEGQRLVLEELCRLITDPENTVDLPDGQPTGDKSTGSLRHDAQARGIVAAPVAPPVES